MVHGMSVKSSQAFLLSFFQSCESTAKVAQNIRSTISSVLLHGERSRPCVIIFLFLPHIMDTHTHTHTYTYTCTHPHTYTHAHTHTTIYTPVT